jgi:hypothetical protein
VGLASNTSDIDRQRLEPFRLISPENIVERIRKDPYIEANSERTTKVDATPIQTKIKP